LLGFDGGTIIGWPDAQTVILDNSNTPLFYILGGSITPVLTSPEPGSLALLPLGLGALLLMRKRMIRPLAV
jgi:hypothetical protein